MRYLAAVLLGLGLTCGGAMAADSAALIARIKAVGTEGKGNPDAAKAWQELVKLGPAALLDILSALDTADATAANWLRSAVDAIAEKETSAGRPLPADKLETFVKDTKHAGSVRRLAYEWLVRVDPKTPGRLLPGMLDDPGAELRRDAVAVVVKQADEQLDKGDKEAATKTFQLAFASSRDRDQVDYIAGQLKKLGVTVDIPAHFGIVQRWLLIGPFDNTNGIGFKAVYPPEKALELNASYPGKGGMVVNWKEHTTTDTYGLVDLNKAISKHMGAVAYAFAAIDSPREQAVDFRATGKNALKMFLNGKQIYFRDEYHHGAQFDGMIGRGTLKMGRNELVLKVCQNEQTQDWAQNWDFRLRICDQIGGAVPFKVLPELPNAK